MTVSADELALWQQVREAPDPAWRAAALALADWLTDHLPPQLAERRAFCLRVMGRRGWRPGLRAAREVRRRLLRPPPLASYRRPRKPWAWWREGFDCADELDALDALQAPWAVLPDAAFSGFFRGYDVRVTFADWDGAFDALADGLWPWRGWLADAM